MKESSSTSPSIDPAQTVEQKLPEQSHWVEPVDAKGDATGDSTGDPDLQPQSSENAADIQPTDFQTDQEIEQEGSGQIQGDTQDITQESTQYDDATGDLNEALAQEQDLDERETDEPEVRPEPTILEVDPEHASRRLDNFLIYKTKLHRGLIYRLLRKKAIRVNRKKSDPGYRVQESDEIYISGSVIMPDAKQTNKLAPPPESLINLLKDSVLFEDDEFLVFSKPSGLAVHGGSGVRHSLAQYVHSQWPEAVPCHRIDKDTSGVILFGKTPSAVRWFQHSAQSGNLSKTYLALVHGKTPATFTTDRAIKVEGKALAALSRFKTLASTSFPSKISLVLAEPITGRKHQLRVHLKQLGFPIIGDKKFGQFAKDRALFEHSKPRMMLHAYRLSNTSGQSVAILNQPETDTYSFTAQVPDEMKEFWGGKKNIWSSI